MSGLHELGRELAESQDRAIKRIDTGRIGQRLEQSLQDAAERSVRPRWQRIAVGMAVAATIAVLFMGLVSVQRQLRPLEFRVEGAVLPAPASSWISASEAPVPIGFSDGSRVVLGPGARARVAQLSRKGAKLDVEQGPVGVSIVPRPGNWWQIELGPFAVEVTGTRFDLDWDPRTERFKMTMHEGKVNVRGCAIGTTPLVAGEILEVSCRDKKYAISALGNEERREEGSKRDDQRASSEPDVTLRPTRDRFETRPERSESSGASSTTGKWKALAEAGRYREALAAADAAGFETECQRLSVSDLLLLASAARLAGEAPKARYANLLLRKRFPTNPASAVAAFHLARVAFELMSDYSAAAQWFETYMREAPSGSLAPEAAGRRLEALQRVGDMRAARDAAKDYLARYPKGSHAEFARRLAR